MPPDLRTSIPAVPPRAVVARADDPPLCAEADEVDADWPEPDELPPDDDWDLAEPGFDPEQWDDPDFDDRDFADAFDEPDEEPDEEPQFDVDWNEDDE